MFRAGDTYDITNMLHISYESIFSSNLLTCSLVIYVFFQFSVFQVDSIYDIINMSRECHYYLPNCYVDSKIASAIYDITTNVSRSS